MEKKQRENNSIVFALSLNALALAASLFVYHPFFEENDDAFLSMIVEGAYGTREPHLIYSNILLGYIYKGLYSLFPAVRWHTVLQYVFLFIALTTFSYIIQKMCTRNSSIPGAGSDQPVDAVSTGSMGRILSVLFTLAVSYEAYVSLQYSKTASLVPAIGYICLLYTFRPIWSMGKGENDDGSGNVPATADNETYTKYEGREVTILRVIAFILLVYGMLLRDYSFLLATLLLLPLGIFEFVMLIRRKIPGAVKEFVLLFASAAFAFLIFICIDFTVYAVDKEWKDFIEYNEIRTDLVDYRYDLLDYNSYGDRLKEKGISENDAFVYLTWQFGDDRIFSNELMNSVMDGAPERPVVECLKGLAKHIYDDVLIMNPLVLGFLLITIGTFTVLIRNGNRKGIKLLVIQLLLVAGIFVYFEYCGRWSHRIVFAAMLVTTMEFVYIMIDADPGNTYLKGITGSGVAAGEAVLIAVACIAVLLGNRFDYNEYRRTEPPYRDFLKSLSKDEDTLYIADTFTFQEAYKYDVFRPYENGDLKNYVAVAGWFVNSPITRSITRSFGYENPYTALAGISEDGSTGGNVILVDNMFTAQKLEYLKEHYGDYSIEELPGRDGFALYRVIKDF